MKARFAPRARRELTAAVSWIARDNRAAATGLRDAVETAARLLGEHPDAGRERPELAGPPYRFMPVTGYPYVLVYDASRHPPLVARVVHGARDLNTLFETNP